ncbi:hypothetical protein FRB96_009031 [Tulasnella sp. 330]|nr:hypothetical protein FRB96_009031 [Tulasnella sp. 330]KAG8874270.1 hypothetical protein FRB97_006042 [Tulasnella sp. 331]
MHASLLIALFPITCALSAPWPLSKRSAPVPSEEQIIRAQILQQTEKGLEKLPELARNIILQGSPRTISEYEQKYHETLGMDDLVLPPGQVWPTMATEVESWLEAETSPRTNWLLMQFTYTPKQRYVKTRLTGIYSLQQYWVDLVIYDFDSFAQEAVTKALLGMDLQWWQLGHLLNLKVDDHSGVVGKTWVNLWHQQVIVGPRGRLADFRSFDGPVQQAIIQIALIGLQNHNRYTLGQAIELNKVIAIQCKPESTVTPGGDDHNGQSQQRTSESWPSRRLDRSFP